MYMESRKTVPMNLLAGQPWRCRHREETCGGWTEEPGRVGAVETGALKHVHHAKTDS